MVNRTFTQKLPEFLNRKLITFCPKCRKPIYVADIEIPTLIVWGKQDPHLIWEMAPESAAMCKDCRLEYLENATHWVLQDEPEKTSRLLIEHLRD